MGEGDNKINENRCLLELLGNRQSLFENILENVNTGIIISKEGIIEWTNSAFNKITGYKYEELIGKDFKKFFLNEDDEKIEKDIFKNLLCNNAWMDGKWSKRKNGEVYLAATKFLTMEDKESESISGLILIDDITSEEYYEDKIETLTFIDPITGSYNKKYILKRLDMELTNAKKNNSSLAAIYIDLDDFHKINNHLGYTIGDKVLKLISKKLDNSVDNKGIVSRFGNDEFLILIPNYDEDENTRIIEDITSNFSTPLIINGYEIHVSMCIGVSTFPSDGTDTESLVRKSNIANKKAKSLGKNNIEFYSQIRTEDEKEEFILENYLRHALIRKEIFLHYQPIINSQTNKLVGVEALLRWKHPMLGMIPPNKFIPISENNGLINPIGEWVLYEACAQNKKWQDDGYEPIFISVNVSVKQLECDDFIDTISKVLDETGLSPRYLELEITENVSGYDTTNGISTLKKLKDMGVGLSIDDFGRGYSSLSQLKKLSASKIKIDKSFIDDIGNNLDNDILVSSIITMANSLKLKVVAEGVENYRQLGFLKKKNCDMFQGYLFSKPLPPEELVKFMDFY